MKVLANVEGLAVPATIETAGVPQGANVVISGDATVDAATAADIVIGHVSVPVKDATEEDGACTIETKYKRLFTAKAVGGALAAGAEVQAGAVDSGSVSTVKALASDSRALCLGIVWIGAAENSEVTVLGY
jgi:hypothetical protein